MITTYTDIQQYQDERGITYYDYKIYDSKIHTEENLLKKSVCYWFDFDEMLNDISDNVIIIKIEKRKNIINKLYLLGFLTIIFGILGAIFKSTNTIFTILSLCVIVSLMLILAIDLYYSEKINHLHKRKNRRQEQNVTFTLNSVANTIYSDINPENYVNNLHDNIKIIRDNFKNKDKEKNNE
jgi:hypothetical protein